MKLVLVLLLVALTVSSGTAQTSEDFESFNITSNMIVTSSFINDNEGWLADNAGTLWHTSNAAVNFNIASTGKYFLKLQFISSLVGYGITSDAAYKSTDGGVTWSALSLPNSIGKTLYFISENVGFITGNEAIYKTSDGGTTWSTVSTEGVSFTDLYFNSSSTGLATAHDEDTYQCIWRTTDGGSTWSNVCNKEKYFMNSVWFTDATNGWAAGYYNEAGRGMLPLIARSADGGLSWEMAYINRHPGDIIGEELLDIRFKNELEGLATSTYSESVITSDGGLTWNLTYYYDESELIPSYGIYKTLDGFSNMYLTGRNGYVTKWE